uniref:YD repeat protein n=1 Tax=Candidatus Giovannonibacteria bacterium GW2011_GWF2_42_19 TaxID=1618659 RepID=A0A0G0Z9X1_9BACT|nr:MAG: YD repeat protein [Candidatus Giovannonibacteria bacterium GW2011_GWF2_42_19]
MAGGVVATVKGTGATAVPYYVATDHLTGSNVVTTSTGTQEELMDYYPFGAIRLDEKAGTFSEQRKFAGQEYDVDTGLSYMNARYYDGLVGRFISQDPLEIVGFQTTDANKFVQVISNPQNWNTYSYALNNPLINVDPSGLYTRAVHGTLPLENISNARAVWQDPTNPLIQNASQTFNEPAELFEWSGGDNHWERLYAASRLAAEINAHPFQPGEQLNLVTHSHGGNIAFLVSQMIDRKIDNLVTFALPVRSDYQPDSSKISNMVNLYSQADLPQVMAGGTYSMSGLLGKAFGDMGEKMGNYLGLGEFGLAGYKVQGAKNIDVTRYSWNPFTAHTNVWQSTKAWNQGVVPNIIK